MSYEDIVSYLRTFKGSKLDDNVFNNIKGLKILAVEQDNQVIAKDLWCLETVYEVLKKYLTAFEKMKVHDFFEAWCSLDEADIELSFLRKHLDYETEFKNVVFIEQAISNFQKLYPYEYFMSRESVIKKERCSVCEEIVSLRSSCTHEVGEIYNGEMCNRIVEDFEFLGMAIVKNPFDKFSVIMPVEVEYNYLMLEHLIKGLSNPFDEWQVTTEERIDENYKGLGRNDKCICGSGEKYKKCCLKNKVNIFLHYQIDFIGKDSSEINELKNLRFRTMRPKSIS